MPPSALRSHADVLVQVRPLSEGHDIRHLSEVDDQVPTWSESVLDIPAPLEVPLLVLPGKRLEFDYGTEEIDFEALGPLRALGLLASTQTGFLPERAPNFRFPGPLGKITDLCIAAAPAFA